jgi:hypothetical protein
MKMTSSITWLMIRENKKTLKKYSTQLPFAFGEFKK